MDDRRVPLETTEGARTAASGSERVLIGLALLALFGAVLITIGNLVGVDLAVIFGGLALSPQTAVAALLLGRVALVLTTVLGTGLLLLSSSSQSGC